jgi:cytochrome bd ubiquinol oxidase subunit II
MQPDLLAAFVILAALMLYGIFGGADYGGGIWDLFAIGPRREAQRTAISRAMGPVWETNHVWLIFVVVALFTCFPPAFATLAIALYVPLTIALAGIVLRGAGFAFRGPLTESNAAGRFWGRIFGIASVLTPFVFGTIAAAIAGGRFAWMSPLGLAFGFFALAICAQLAATFLCTETTGTLRDDFRTRALWATGAVMLAGLLGLIVARAEPSLAGALGGTRVLMAIGTTMTVGALALLLLVYRAFFWARLVVAIEVAGIFAGWYAMQAPRLMPGTTLDELAAPPITIVTFLWIAAAGAVVLLPSLALLFRVFKSSEGATAPEP